MDRDRLLTPYVNAMASSAPIQWALVKLWAHVRGAAQSTHTIRRTDRELSALARWGACSFFFTHHGRVSLRCASRTMGESCTTHYAIGHEQSSVECQNCPATLRPKLDSLATGLKNH
jgi:hypothetical protein